MTTTPPRPSDDMPEDLITRHALKYLQQIEDYLQESGANKFALRLRALRCAIMTAPPAPVDTGWIDEMRKEQNTRPDYNYTQQEDDAYCWGYNDALYAVKQKLEGRG